MCSDSFHQSGESSGSFPNAPVDLRPKGEVVGHCWAQVHRLVDGFQVVVWNADGSRSMSWPIICIFLRLMVSPESSQASAKWFMSHCKPMCSDGHIVCKQEVPETFHLHPKFLQEESTWSRNVGSEPRCPLSTWLSHSSDYRKSAGNRKDHLTSPLSHRLYMGAVQHPQWGNAGLRSGPCCLASFSLFYSSMPLDQPQKASTSVHTWLKDGYWVLYKYRVIIMISIEKERENFVPPNLIIFKLFLRRIKVPVVNEVSVVAAELNNELQKNRSNRALNPKPSDHLNRVLTTWLWGHLKLGGS